METHHTPDTSAPLPPPVHLSPIEAEAVVALWQQEQMGGGTAARPTVQDVAEGLDISPDDVRRLLAQVRASGTGDDSQSVHIAREHQKLARRIAWATAAATGAITLGAWLLHFL